MNDARINWQKFLLIVSQKVAAYFRTLTSDERKKDGLAIKLWQTKSTSSA
ncbi:hypothetical protein [Vagococcus acidifermentans]|nr:hypothetical protein [Vagococcus acidifermentans]